MHKLHASMHCTLKVSNSCVAVSCRSCEVKRPFRPNGSPAVCTAAESRRTATDKAVPRLIRHATLGSCVHAFKMHASMHCTLKASQVCVPVSTSFEIKRLFRHSGSPAHPAADLVTADEAVPRLIRLASCFEPSFMHASCMPINKPCFPVSYKFENSSGHSAPTAHPYCLRFLDSTAPVDRG